MAGVVDLGHGETARVKARMHRGEAGGNAGDEATARAKELAGGNLGMNHTRQQEIEGGTATLRDEPAQPLQAHTLAGRNAGTAGCDVDARQYLQRCSGKGAHRGI